jgi:hypothetical protein
MQLALNRSQEICVSPGCTGDSTTYWIGCSEEPTTEEALEIPLVINVVIAISVAFTLVIGFFPNVLLNAIDLVRFAPN